MERTYCDISKLESFEERLNYAKLSSAVGEETFGFDRYLNQQFYRSKEWKRIRDQVILRDDGCDLGHRDRPIIGKIFIHHLNPITSYDLKNNVESIEDLENLICVSLETHNFIHYGIEKKEPKVATERQPNDTCPWRQS